MYLTVSSALPHSIAAATGRTQHANAIRDAARAVQYMKASKKLPLYNALVVRLSDKHCKLFLHFGFTLWHDQCIPSSYPEFSLNLRKRGLFYDFTNFVSSFPKNEFCSQKIFAHWFSCIPLEVIERALVLRARFFRQVLEAGQVYNSKVAEKLMCQVHCCLCAASKDKSLLIMHICIPQKLCIQGKLLKICAIPPPKGVFAFQPHFNGGQMQKQPCT